MKRNNFTAGNTTMDLRATSNFYIHLVRSPIFERLTSRKSAYCYVTSNLRSYLGHQINTLTKNFQLLTQIDFIFNCISKIFFSVFQTNSCCWRIHGNLSHQLHPYSNWQYAFSHGFYGRTRRKAVDLQRIKKLEFATNKFHDANHTSTRLSITATHHGRGVLHVLKHQFCCCYVSSKRARASTFLNLTLLPEPLSMLNIGNYNGEEDSDNTANCLYPPRPFCSCHTCPPRVVPKEAVFGRRYFHNGPIVALPSSKEHGRAT